MRRLQIFLEKSRGVLAREILFARQEIYRAIIEFRPSVDCKMRFGNDNNPRHAIRLELMKVRMENRYTRAS